MPHSIPIGMPIPVRRTDPICTVRSLCCIKQRLQPTIMDMKLTTIDMKNVPPDNIPF